MTTTKTSLLASAALIVAATGAQAADLPFRKAAPVEYVRICDAYGAGFFYIPGTDTCLRVLGQVRAEETFRINAPVNNPGAFAYNQSGQQYRRDVLSFRGRAYLNADARTQTAYGTLRAFVSIRSTVDTSTAGGPLGGRGAFGVAGVPNGVRASTGLFQGAQPSGTTYPDKAFIQFAGITAGRSQSFFDFDAQSYELLTNSVANSNEATVLLGYTATFGGGFSATVSVEDPAQRRTGDNGTFVFSTRNTLSAAYLTGGAFGSQNNPTLSNQRASVLGYAGESLPDVVANIRYDAAWGSAQISGAYHEVNSVPVAVLPGTSAASLTPLVGVALPSTSPTEAGFAVQGGIKVLLPSLAKGDSVTFQGVYSSGAMDYADSNNYFNGLSSVYDKNANYGVPVNDAYINTAGKIVKAEAYGGYAAFRHYFIPDVYGSLYGAFLQIDTPIQAQRLGTSTDSARIFQIGGNVVWTPVKDFQIGGEALYSDIRYESNANGLVFPGQIAGPLGNLQAAGTLQNPSDVRARLSLRRAF